MAAATSIFAHHLSFDQQCAMGDVDPMPCACWLAGHGDIRGITQDQVQHPRAFGDGWAAAFEREHDI